MNPKLQEAWLEIDERLRAELAVALAPRYRDATLEIVERRPGEYGMHTWEALLYRDGRYSGELVIVNCLDPAPCTDPTQVRIELREGRQRWVGTLAELGAPAALQRSSESRDLEMR